MPDNETVTVLALMLACVAAVVLAAGSVMQQRAVREWSRLVRPPVRRVGLRLASLLAGSPLWIAGGVVAVLGFAFHAAALHIGSLAVVQPVLTLSLPVSVLVSGPGRMRRRRSKRHVSASDWIGIGCLCAGVAVFLGVGAPVSGPARSRMLLLLATVIAAAIVGLLYLLGRDGSPATHGVLWGSAAAVAFGLAAGLTKAVTADVASGGITKALLAWPTWVLPVAAFGGLILEQAAFAGGTLTSVMMPVTLLNPMTAALLGLFAWHDHFTAGPIAILIAIGLSLILAIVGVTALSRSPLMHPPPSRVY